MLIFKKKKKYYKLSTKQIIFIAIGLLVISLQSLFRFTDNEMKYIAFYTFVFSVISSVITVSLTLKNKMSVAVYFLLLSCILGILSIFLKVI